MQLFSILKPPCVVWLGGVALWANAQAPTPQTPPPAPSLTVPSWVYASPLAGYRRYSDAPVQDWGAANQTVRDIGGWRTYAQEAQVGAGGHRHGANQSAQTVPGGGKHEGHRP